MRITWKELTVSLDGLSSDDLLGEWRWLVPPELSLHLVSTLGDCFLMDKAGAIYWLDVGGAELTRIANSSAEFDALRQQSNNASQWFCPQLVGDLLSEGKSLKPHQCFSYKTPLTLGGEYSPENFEPTDIAVHFGVLGQIQKQVKAFPVGTEVRGVRFNEEL
jgi:hypothetical protein